MTPPLGIISLMTQFHNNFSHGNCFINQQSFYNFSYGNCSPLLIRSLIYFDWMASRLPNNLRTAKMKHLKLFRSLESSWNSNENSKITPMGCKNTSLNKQILIPTSRDSITTCNMCLKFNVSKYNGIANGRLLQIWWAGASSRNRSQSAFHWPLYQPNWLWGLLDKTEDAPCFDALTPTRNLFLLMTVSLCLAVKFAQIWLLICS